MEKEKTAVSKCLLLFQSNPQNDVDIVKSEISLKHPDLIQVKANWEEDGAKDLLLSLKKKVPKMVAAVYNSVNKYHRQHMGMDINTAGLKLKEKLKTNVDRTYRETLKSINALEHQATAKYEDLKMKTMKLYDEAADQAARIDYDQIRTTVFDTIMGIIQEYQKRMKHLIDSAIVFLKETTFQVPGLAEKHTGEELFFMATAKLQDVTDLCISKVQEKFDALMRYVSELEFKIPASSQIIRGSDVLNEIKAFLTHIRKKTSDIFVGLREINFAEKLRELKVFVQQVSQQAEELVRDLRTRNYESIIDQAKLLFTNNSEKLKHFAEQINYILPRTVNIIQNMLQSIISKLEESLEYLKDLRPEYLDPSVAEWSIKYYEMKDRLVDWLKSLLDVVAKWNATYLGDAANFVSRVMDQVQEFVAHHGNVTELSESARDKIHYWSEVAKKSAAEQNQEVKAKLQEAYEIFSTSTDRLIAEIQKLIDLTIENYTAFLQYIKELLDQLEQATADALRPYMAVRQGELRIDIPKPFDWPSAYRTAQFSEEDSRRQELMQQGIDQSLQQWEELQRLIDQQRAAKQTKENVQS